MSEVKTVDSAGDDRVANNLMRHKYRVLSSAEKEAMVRIKDAGLEFVQLLHTVGGSLTQEQIDAGADVELTRQGSRELSIAQTKIEEAVMWAVKHVTK